MPTILLVEDDPIIADTLRYALETECFQVIWHTTGTEALTALAHAPPDLVLLDVGLPDINGFEVLKRIRQVSDVPVIFTTARNDEIDKVLGLELGADDYVTKPLSPRELVARVKANLKRAPVNARPEPLGHSTFIINEKLKTISFYQQELPLTKAEYNLLEHLIRHPRQVFSRDQLLTAIWDARYAADERTVDTHIKSLRAKLKAIQPDSDCIKTHRGLGYSILP
jgi:two-component system, OmpR family, catabolic regulation response regulator CreB